MKWAFIFLFVIYLIPSPVYSEIRVLPQSNIQSLTSQLNIPNTATRGQFLLFKSGLEKKLQLKYDSIASFVAVLLLLITTFLVVITPLVLIYFWIYYSYIYVNKFRRIFSVKKWIFTKSRLHRRGLSPAIKSSYRRVYSLMLGFGIAILAYGFSSLRFMMLNFDKLEVAVFEYFRFPFLVLDEFRNVQPNRESELNFDNFWNQMLLIVVISSLFFIIGYLLGSVLVDLRFKFLNKKAGNLMNKRTIHKEMFHIKTDKDFSSQKKVETIDFF